MLNIGGQEGQLLSQLPGLAAQFLAATTDDALINFRANQLRQPQVPPSFGLAAFRAGNNT